MIDPLMPLQIAPVLPAAFAGAAETPIIASGDSSASTTDSFISMVRIL